MTKLGVFPQGFQGLILPRLDKADELFQLFAVDNLPCIAIGPDFLNFVSQSPSFPKFPSPQFTRFAGDPLAVSKMFAYRFLIR